MYKRLKHKVISTLMVTVLFVQQLFGAYHLLTKHANDYANGIDDDQEMVSSSETECELCAKLDSKPVIVSFNVDTVFSTFHFPLPRIVKKETPSSLRRDAIYRRGPPAYS